MAEFPRAFGTRLKSTLQATNTEVVSVRPLNFGADTVTPRSMSKLRRLENLYADNHGWHLRPALREFMSPITVATGEEIVDYADMGVVSQYSTFIAIGSKFIYNTNDGLTWRRSPWGKESFATASLSGTALVTVDDLEADYNISQSLIDVSAIYLMFDDGTGEYTERIELTAISGTSITLASTPTATHPTSFQLFYEFRALDPYVVQWTSGPDRMIYLVDGSNIGIMTFDGRYLNRLATYGNELMDPGTGEPYEPARYDPCPFSGAFAIQYIDGRLVVGNTLESETSQGYRMLRWSTPAAMAQFQSNDYVMLTLSSGVIMSIKTIENYLIVSLQDDMYVGKPYQGDATTYFSMPWIFKRLETSGRVPVGQRAIVSALNAIVYIGSDDVYSLSFKALNAQGDFIVVPLECPVRDQAFNSSDMHLASIVYSQETDLMLFAFEKPFTSLWAMNMKSMAWSLFTFSLSMNTFARSIFVPRETYESMEALGYTYDDPALAGRTYMSFMIGFGTFFVVFIDEDGAQYIFDTSSYTDEGDVQINPVFETGDMDFDAPDDDKTIYRFGLLADGSFRLYLYGSTNRGVSWKDLGQMELANNENELHFRLSGDKLALRATLPIVTSTLRIESFTMALKTTGESVIRGGV